MKYRNLCGVFTQKRLIRARHTLSITQCIKCLVTKPFESQKPVRVDLSSFDISRQKRGHELLQALCPEGCHGQFPKLSFERSRDFHNDARMNKA